MAQDYSAGVAELSTVHGMLANTQRSAAPAQPWPVGSIGIATRPGFAAPQSQDCPAGVFPHPCNRLCHCCLLGCQASPFALPGCGGVHGDGCDGHGTQGWGHGLSLVLNLLIASRRILLARA